MQRIHSRLFVVAVSMLAGCAVAPSRMDQAANVAAIAADTGVAIPAASPLVRCDAAQAEPGAKSGYFLACLYVPLPDGAALVGFDEQASRFRLLSRFELHSVRGVALQAMGNARQLQLTTADGFIVVNLLSDNRAWSDSAASSVAVDHLRALGISVVDPVRMVMVYRDLNVKWHIVPAR